MFITIETRVNKVISESLGSKTIINNSFNGRSIATISPQGQEMLIDQADTKEWVFDSTTGPAFTLDLLTKFNTTIDKIKFLHIACYKDIRESGDQHAPIRFSLNIGGVALGKMSQYQIANADGLVGANITVSNIEASGADYAILQVLACIKQ